MNPELKRYSQQDCMTLYSDRGDWSNSYSYTLPTVLSNNDRKWYTLSQGETKTQSLGRNATKTPEARRHRYNIREAFKNSKLVIFGTLLRRRKKKKPSSNVRDSILQFPEISTHYDSKLHRRALNYEDGQLVSGRLDELIKLLMPIKDSTHSYFPDRNYIFTFILCSRLFITPESVLERVYDMSKQSIREYKDYTSDILKMVVQLLQEWTAHFPYDFKKKNMMNQFNKICKLCTKHDPEISSSINLISTHLVSKFDDLLRFINEHNIFQIPCDEDVKVLTEICIDPLIMAQQLTIMELEKLSKVSAEQFIERFIAEDVTVSKMDLTSNQSPIEIYVGWFNRLSRLVATEICACPKLKGRTRIVNYFIDVAKQCLKLGNFNSLMAIIVGLNMNSVARMAKTWSKCNDNSFKRLEKIVSPDRNFYRYRKKLNKKLNEGSEYVVPVFSVFVKDMYVLNEGIKDRLPNNLINFQKFWHISKQVNDMMILKSKVCHYVIDNVIIDYLLNTPACSEDMLYKSSFDVEQPVTEFERNRYQSVRGRLNKERKSSVS